MFISASPTRLSASLRKASGLGCKPWSAEHAAGRIMRPLRGNGIPYQGINVLMLWSAAMEKGYAAPIWMTFKQALEFKAHVRKGEHGSLVVYADKIIRTETDADDRRGSRARHPLHEGLHGFQCRADRRLARAFLRASPSRGARPCSASTRAECFFAATGADIVHGGSRACYIISHDHIHMPCIDCFRDAESYYATLAHETTHWTRHPSRLDRDFGRKRLGDEGYAMEELVAELGSAFLSADLDLTPEVRDDHAAYIASWIKVLKDDKRAIFTAASHAQRAADFLHGLQPAAASEPEARKPQPRPRDMAKPDILYCRWPRLQLAALVRIAPPADLKHGQGRSAATRAFRTARPIAGRAPNGPPPAGIGSRACWTECEARVRRRQGKKGEVGRLAAEKFAKLRSRVRSAAQLRYSAALRALANLGQSKMRGSGRKAKHSKIITL